LDELDFVSTESSQVGDIEDTVISFGVFSMDTSDLDVIFVSNGLMHFWVFHEFWEVDVNGSSKTGSEVGWAGRDVTEMGVVGELSFSFNKAGSLRESRENSSNIA